MDFENYVKANDTVLNNVQNQGQNLQNQMANITSLLTSLCNNFKNSASTSNPGTLPSQTVTNPRQQINAVTTRSGKTLEEPSIPLVPTPDVSISQNESNMETSTEKVQNPNSENTAHVPSLGEEDSIFMEIPNPKAKKTINVEVQDLNSPRPDSYPSKLPYPERMKSPEKLKESRKISYPMSLQELNRNKCFIHFKELALTFYLILATRNLGLMHYSYSGSTTNILPPSSSPMKTSDNFEKFTDELAPLDIVTHREYDKDAEIKSSSSFTLTSPEESELEA
ncbi:hypothetical protein Tco_0536418 [Tanacetum coccineum]